MGMRVCGKRRREKEGRGVLWGWYCYGNYQRLLFQGVDRGLNMDNYSSVLSVMKRHFHRRTNQTTALAEWQWPRSQ